MTHGGATLLPSNDTAEGRIPLCSGTVTRARSCGGFTTCKTNRWSWSSAVFAHFQSTRIGPWMIGTVPRAHSRSTGFGASEYSAWPGWTGRTPRTSVVREDGGLRYQGVVGPNGPFSLGRRCDE
jgi:hypothetical protein